MDKPKHIVLTSHPGREEQRGPKIQWGDADPKTRGPVIGSVQTPAKRNVIGTHSGSYAIYRALAVASGQLDADHVPDLTDTTPIVPLGPHPQWSDPDKIVSLDPFGHLVGEAFAEELKSGLDIRPTIAVTRARLHLPEFQMAVKEGRLKPDGKFLMESGEVSVTKIAVEPVWYLPGVAKPFGIDESQLRRSLFEQTGGMFPELVTRPDHHVFLPPIGSITVYLVGDPATITDPKRKLACRVHDECNGSDVFGSDICTCRPYLVFGIEDAVRTAQRGGVGIVVYFRKEGRALGEVTKFLVYNARKRQPDGDNAATYFHRTECVAGVQDARFQEFMPDVLNYFGITKIDNLHSMSNMKYDAITAAGIRVINRIKIPEDLIPADARVEIEAKKAAGYFSDEDTPNSESLRSVKGRDLT